MLTVNFLDSRGIPKAFRCMLNVFSKKHGNCKELFGSLLETYKKLHSPRKAFRKANFITHLTLQRPINMTERGYRDFYESLKAFCKR
jgi:hypothetical protein